MGKKGLIIKTWERCTSFAGSRKNSMGLPRHQLGRKSKSCPSLVTSSDEEARERRRRVAPEGCFSVYVGPQKQRFVVKTEYVNHPMFKVLLEEAEFEYGYNSVGPLALPCTVEFFLKVLVEMDGGGGTDDQIIQKGCVFPMTRSSSSYRLLP